MMFGKKKVLGYDVYEGEKKDSGSSGSVKRTFNQTVKGFKIMGGKIKSAYNSSEKVVKSEKFQNKVNGMADYYADVIGFKRKK